MAFPTNDTELRTLLDAMKAQDAPKEEMKFMIDTFVQRQSEAPKPEAAGLGVRPIDTEPATAGDVVKSKEIPVEGPELAPEDIGAAAQEAIGLPGVKESKGLLGKFGGAKKGEVVVKGKKGLKSLESVSEGAAQAVKEDKPSPLLSAVGAIPAAESIGGQAKAGTETVLEGLKEQFVDPLTTPLSEQADKPVGVGFRKILEGGLQTLFSPISGAIQEVPGGEKIAQVLSKPFELGGDLIEGIADSIAKKAGVDINSEQWKEAKRQLAVAGEVGTLAIGGAGTRVIPSAAKGAAVGVKKVPGLAGGVGKEAISKATGLDRQTLRTLADSPDKVAAVKKIGTEAARNDVFRKVKTTIDDTLKEFSETGAQYSTIRESGQRTQLPSTFYDDLVKGEGLTPVVKDGKLVGLEGSSKSSVRADVDLTALTKSLKPFWGKLELDANEFLNLRSDLAQAAKFETGKTTAATAASKAWRAKLNDSGRKQIEGLEELDLKFAPQIDEMKQIKSLLYDRKGDLKDNAIQTVNNLLGKGKEAKFARIEKLMPDLADNIKAIKAIEDVNLAGGNKIGTYLRGTGAAGLGASILAGNIAAIPALAGLVLTNPSVMAEIIRTFGATKAGLSASRIGSITGKISDGIKLTKQEAAAVSKMMPKITDLEVAEFLIATEGLE